MTTPISRLFLIVLLCCCVALPAVSVAGEDDKALRTAQRLSDHLGSLDSLSFSFNQRTMGQMSGRPRQASGQAYFAKTADGAMMRWNYQAPDRQVIISDGSTLSMYFANLNQMIIAPADELQQDVTYSFFAGESDLEKDFLVSSATTGKDAPSGQAVLKLVPRSPTSQVKEIHLWVTGGTQIKRIEITDTFDTVTLLNISNIAENSLTRGGRLIEPAFFQFTPPPGTEIIHQ